jgi:glycosyltransferase involved in cell wall biosynthesis
MPGGRALVVSGSPLISGGEVSLLRALECLPSQGWECRTAVVAPAPGDTAVAFERLGLPPDLFIVERLRSVRAGRRAVRGLSRLARDVDVIHANDIRAAFYCQAAALIARRPWTFHARDLYVDGSRFERALRFVRPTRVAAMSGPVASRAASLFRWPASRIEVVHAGLDGAAWRAAADRDGWRAEVGLEPAEVAIGIVGRLVGWKGQDDFVRAAARVARREPDARFFIVGGELVDDATAWGLGPEADRLTSLASSLGVRERLTLTGPRADVASVMAGLDVVVVASWAEPFGLVLLEAMTQGTPVIATAAGGVPEIVIDGESGLLVPPRSPDHLAEAIERLLENVELRRRLGDGGRARALRAFPAETEAVGLAGLWSHVLG